MPIYEYACSSCGREFEKLVRSDTVLACPDCGGDDLKKLLSTFAVSVGGTRSSRQDLPAPCNTCGNPGGPGSCGLN